MSDEVSTQSRNRALVILGITLLLAALAWVFVNKATDAGIARLDKLDRARAECDSLFIRARNQGDSLRAAAHALRDTVDAQSDEAIETCGDLRKAK